MSNASSPSATTGIPPLDIPEQKILQRVNTNPNSRTARVLSDALRLSIAPVNPEAPEESIGPNGIVERYGSAVDLQTLNDYRVILSKKEGCQMLGTLGVQKLQENEGYLNRYFSKKVYKDLFGRKVSSVKGKGNNKLLFTYGEIVYFYSEYLGNSIPDPLPTLPNSLIEYADEVNDYL